MQDSRHLTVILCSSVIKIVISQKQKVNRKNNYYYYYYLCFPRLHLKIFKFTLDICCYLYSNCFSRHT
jgi:hypothetical protein